MENIKPEKSPNLQISKSTHYFFFVLNFRQIVFLQDLLRQVQVINRPLAV